MLASGDAYKLLRDGHLEVPRKFRNVERFLVDRDISKAAKPLRLLGGAPKSLGLPMAQALMSPWRRPTSERSGQSLHARCLDGPAHGHILMQKHAKAQSINLCCGS